MPEEGKSILARLLELEAHDLSEYVETLRANRHGLFGYAYLDHYWTEAGRFPYFIRSDGELAGLVLIRMTGERIEMAEFFVLRSHRRAGVGARAAALAFSRHSGEWEVLHAARNAPAAAFWSRVIHAGAVSRVSREDRSDGTVVFRFASQP